MQAAQQPDGRDKNLQLDQKQKNVSPGQGQSECIASGCRVYQPSVIRRILFGIACLLTVGIFALICYWFRKLLIWCCYSECTQKYTQSREKATKAVVKDQYNQSLICDHHAVRIDNEIVGLITYKNVLYRYDELSGQLVPTQFDPEKPFFFYHEEMSKGLTSSDVIKSRIVNGENNIETKMPHIVVSFIEEGLQPFTIFQVFSIIVWFLYNYEYYAGLILLITVFSVIIAVYQTRQNKQRLQEMTRFECPVTVYRRTEATNGAGQYELKRQVISSKDIQPGDVFEVEEERTLACDGLLLAGQCIIDESMLTGESAAVIKTGIPVIQVPNQYTQQLNVKELSRQNAESALNLLTGTIAELEILRMDRDKQHILYGGTRVVRARDTTSGSGIGVPLCVALRTGFSTAKGQLVRSILFPKPQTRFKFYEDSFKFIGILGIIAVGGFIVNAVMQSMYGESVDQIILRALDLITIAVPPTLPAIMSSGISYALSRLKGRKIYCIASERINVAGKVKVMCFDKTGTLTEEVLGVRGVKGVRDVRRRIYNQQQNQSPKDETNSNTDRDGQWSQTLGVNVRSGTITNASETASISSKLSFSKQELVQVTEFAALRRTPDEVLRVADWGFGTNQGISESDRRINDSDREVSYGVSSFDGRSMYTQHISGLGGGQGSEKLKLLMSGLASCHSIGDMKGKYIGDPLDIVMLKFTEWKFTDMENVKKNDNNKRKSKKQSTKKNKKNNKVKIMKKDSQAVRKLKHQKNLAPFMSAIVCTPEKYEQNNLGPDIEPNKDDTQVSLASFDSYVKNTVLEEAAGILKRFDFTAPLQRMSVIVLRASPSDNQNAPPDINQALNENQSQGSEQPNSVNSGYQSPTNLHNAQLLQYTSETSSYPGTEPLVNTQMHLDLGKITNTVTLASLRKNHSAVFQQQEQQQQQQISSQSQLQQQWSESFDIPSDEEEGFKVIKPPSLNIQPAQSPRIVPPPQLGDQAQRPIQHHLTLEIFTKGSPEVIRKLCRKETLPEDFDTQLSTYTQQGLRIIALAHKEIKEDLLKTVDDDDNNEINNEKDNKNKSSNLLDNLEYEKIRKLPRDQCEIDLTFLGFLVLENRLRPTSKASIGRLQDAGIRCVMVTGDNVLTAVSIARQCHIIPIKKQVKMISQSERYNKEKKKRSQKKKKGDKSDKANKYKANYQHVQLNVQPPPVFLCVVTEDGQNVEWQCADYPDWKLNPETLVPVYAPKIEHEFQAPKQDIEQTRSVVSIPELEIQRNNDEVLGMQDIGEQSLNKQKRHRTGSIHIIGDGIFTDEEQQEEEQNEQGIIKRSKSLPHIGFTEQFMKGKDEQEEGMESIDENQPGSGIDNKGNQEQQPINVTDIVRNLSVDQLSGIQKKRKQLFSNPFAGWRGGPWGILLYLGRQLPDRFFPKPFKNQSDQLQSPPKKIPQLEQQQLIQKLSNNKSQSVSPRNQGETNLMGKTVQYGSDEPIYSKPVIQQSPPFNGYFLAVTGSAFNVLSIQDQKEKELQDKLKLEMDVKNKAGQTIEKRPIGLFEKICFLACVFARMGPDDKARLVETLMDLGQVVGMCGDGANDCGALKAAHVGISLSEVEASIAAPFTSKEATVEAVESVLQEGRAALASSFHAFKTTAVFSMVQFMSSVILIYFDSKLADFGYLVQDMLFTLPILFTVSYSKSAAGLTKKTPLGSLMSFPVVSSLLIHVAMTLIYQILCLVILITVCKDFVPLPIDDDNYDLHVQSYEMTTVLFSSFVSYFVSGFVLHVYDKHLEAWYKNIAFD
ncbi:MAG: putative Vacuolar cation-transporting ATPase YPK9, partial [Streblomastix strix]